MKLAQPALNVLFEQFQERFVESCRPLIQFRNFTLDLMKQFDRNLLVVLVALVML